MITIYKSIVGILFSLLLIPFAANAATVSVSANDNFFAQKNISITAGDTVVWTNNGSMVHTVTADNLSFDSGNILPTQSYTRTFNTPGTYQYYCKLHGSPGGVGMAGTVTVAAAATPVATTQTQTSYGLTADALRAQIEDLLRRIQILQQQIAVAGGGTPAQTTPATQITACPRVGVTLSPGSKGEDVTRLQQFLALDGTIYPERLVTGYYGSLTRAAVERWQARNNIVTSGSPETTGYGQYGPRTAALMALQCQGGGISGQQVGGFIKVTPISGQAPLTVHVEATINTTRACNVATYTLDYGDGSPVLHMPISAGVCTEQKRSLVHVYQYAGTYVITLSAGGHKTQATVVVGGATPPQTPPSTPATCAGDIAAAERDASGKVCTQVITGLLCPYNTAYTYSARNGCISSYLKARGWKVESEIAPTTEYGGMSITPDPDGDYLTIEAVFDVGSCDGYNLSWGDGDDASQSGASSCTSNTISSKTLSHTYSNTGSYTISLTRGSQTDLVDVVIVAD